MKAIKDTGNLLVAAVDKSDSVGIIDSYFPDARFFVEFERFDRHVDKLRRARHLRKTTGVEPLEHRCAGGYPAGARPPDLQHPAIALAPGFLHLAHARVRWFLSVNEAYLPEEAKAKGQRTFRAIMVDGQAFEFSEGFTELHTASYRHILEGPGFGLEEARPSIEIVHAIREAQPLGAQGDYHPFVRTVLSRS